MSKPEGVLSKIRVVEWSQGHAAAYAGLLLAESGADVVLIDGDRTGRRQKLASFAVWDRSKRRLERNCRAPEDAQALQDLLSEADILLTDVTPHDREKLGLGSRAIKDRHPHLIITEIGSWPAGHKLENRPVDDTLVLAEAGLMDEQAGVRDGPIYLRFPLGSWGSAYLAAIGTLARLIQKRRGRGVGGVSTSLVQGALAPSAMLWRKAERATPEFTNSMGKSIRSPQFECSDGVWIHVKSTPDHAPLMSAALQELGADRIADLNAGEKGDHICPNWGANKFIFKSRPSDVWLADLWSADVAVQPDVPMGHIYGDEQAILNGYVIDVENPVFGKTRQPGAPVSIEPPMRAFRPAASFSPWRDGDWSSERAGSSNSSSPGAAEELPLNGVKVADFGAFLAGPFATMMLSDLGADVVKVEGLTGDPLRRNDGAFFGCQRGKRSLAVDLKHETAADIIASLAEWADIVHHNIRLPAAHRLGIVYETLSVINPELIYCHVSAYGPKGPRKDWPGYDQLFQAQTGWEFEGAGEGNQPMWHRFGMMDHQCALASLFVTLLGLYHRDNGHGGQAVDASLLGAGLMTVSETIVLEDGSLTPYPGLDQQQMGVSSTRRLYRCMDGWVAFASDAPDTWSSLQQHSGQTSVSGVEDYMAGLTVVEALGLADDCAIAATEARTDNRDRFFADPANLDKGLVARFNQSKFGMVDMVGTFWLFDGQPALPQSGVPDLGEHTAQCLEELGFSPVEIRDFCRNKIVADLRNEVAE
jgi:crotonobetainyl-CoA:carnitine CoA-transferase CaiB-like acyl-CoA transferase